MKHILKCGRCSIYTMKEECPKCGNKTAISRPAKFSPKDPYARYRRKAKEEILAKRGSS